MSSEKQIIDLEKLRNSIIEEILRIHSMIPGSFNQVYCKCGKKNCWCYGKDKGHTFRRIIWSEKGVPKTKVIPQQDVDWIKDVTESYRTFRKKRKEIQILEDSIRRLLDEYAKDIVKNTRKLREYL